MLNPDGSLDGHIYFHLGDDSSFHAVPFDTGPPHTERSALGSAEAAVKPAGHAVDAIELAVEAALAPGRFISEHASDSFVDELQQVKERIAGIIGTEPGLAVALYETFIAGC
jgi:hypothetical protein